MHTHVHRHAHTGMHTQACTHTQAYARKHRHAHTGICTHKHAYTGIGTHRGMHTHTGICMHTQAYTHTQACTQAYAHTGICTHVHTHFLPRHPPHPQHRPPLLSRWNPPCPGFQPGSFPLSASAVLKVATWDSSGMWCCGSRRGHQGDQVRRVTLEPAGCGPRPREGEKQLCSLRKQWSRGGTQIVWGSEGGPGSPAFTWGWGFILSCFSGCRTRLTGIRPLRMWCRAAVLICALVIEVCFST